MDLIQANGVNVDGQQDQQGHGGMKGLLLCAITLSQSYHVQILYIIKTPQTLEKGNTRHDVLFSNFKLSSVLLKSGSSKKHLALKRSKCSKPIGCYLKYINGIICLPLCHPLLILDSLILLLCNYCYL